MDEIQITDLSSRVLNAMRARNLKAKPITEFERYGLRRILLHFSEHEWIAYSKEAVWAFVLQERLRVCSYPYLRNTAYRRLWDISRERAV